MVAKVEEGPIIVYNLNTKAKTVINERKLGVQQLGDKMCVSSVGDKVVVSGSKVVVCAGEKNDEHLAFIWDAAKGEYFVTVGIHCLVSATNSDDGNLLME